MTETIARYADLAGQVAVVTGASRGIGAGIARALAAQGVEVVLTGRDQQALEAVAESIHGGKVHTVVAELTNEHAVQALREEAERAFGPVSMVAAVAGGLGAPAPFLSLTPDSWRQTVDANLTSAFLTLKAFLPGMVERGHGSIVTTSSTAGRIATPASAAYGAANAGLLMLTRQAATEMAPHHVRINAIAPGAVLTERWRHAPQSVRDEVAGSHPLGRIGTVEDIAGTALFLLSDASSWITGATLDVNGGRVMM